MLLEERTRLRNRILNILNAEGATNLSPETIDNIFGERRDPEYDIEWAKRFVWNGEILPSDIHAYEEQVVSPKAAVVELRGFIKYYALNLSVPDSDGAGVCPSSLRLSTYEYARLSETLPFPIKDFFQQLADKINAPEKDNLREVFEYALALQNHRHMRSEGYNTAVSLMLSFIRKQVLKK